MSFLISDVEVGDYVLTQWGMDKKKCRWNKVIEVHHDRDRLTVKTIEGWGCMVFLDNVKDVCKRSDRSVLINLFPELFNTTKR